MEEISNKRHSAGRNPFVFFPGPVKLLSIKARDREPMKLAMLTVTDAPGSTTPPLPSPPPAINRWEVGVNGK